MGRDKMLNMEYLLLHSEPWLQYTIRFHLLHEKREDLMELRSKALEDKKVKTWISDVADFHGTLVNNHKNPGLPIHKLLFLLDIGFDRSVPEIQCAIDAIMKHKDEHGIYQSLINIPKHFGGSGEDTFGWSLCDAPLMLFALLEADIDYDMHIKQGVDYLASLFQNQGYLCVVSPELGKFRGPGRKDDCCPYATLIMLKLLSGIPEYKESELAGTITESLLSLWENSLQSHPYMFYMGTDFRKLKAPAIWYDIVSTADVLCRFDCIREDGRFLEMLSLIQNKEDANGLFTPESVYLKCSDWDFGQKKAPSPYLTYLCERILRRVRL